jgi:hypothetical protein
MIRVLKYSLLLFLAACNRQSDIVFSASDELHHLDLHRQNHTFEMLYNGINTIEGHYQWRNDTIFLTYGEEEYLDSKERKRHANTILTRIIVMDRNTKSIHSIDGKPFCGAVVHNEFK